MNLKNIKGYPISVFFFCFSLSLFISSCTKEDVLAKKKVVEIEPSVTVKNGHLNFPSVESFKNLMTQMQANETPSLGDEICSKFEENGFRVLNSKHKQSSKSSSNLSKFSSFVEVEEDTLIADPYFAAVLNEDKEIEVDGYVYKIDEYGTFFGPSDKLAEIDTIIKELDESEASALPGEIVADKLYRISDEVYLYDSFSYNAPDEIGNSTEFIEITDPTAASGGSISPYGDIVTYKFEAKTLAGKAIEALFGRSRAHNREFKWNRRIRVNFYNVNYIVYSAIGVNVKYQKKNWIGWSTTECEELRWGWDGFQYSFKLPYPMPTTGPAPVQTQYTYVPGIKAKLAFTANFWNYRYSTSINLVNELNQRLIRWWGLLEERYAPDAVEMRKNQLNQFREIFPDKVIVDVDRYEEIKYNCESISKVFDWGTCEVSINFISGNSWVLHPGLKDNALSFDVSKASFYGIAKCDGHYKGVRIMKD